MLIGYMPRKPRSTAAEWVALAEAAGADDGIEFPNDFFTKPIEKVDISRP